MTKLSETNPYYRTDNATATAADITAGKVAYIKGGRVVGQGVDPIYSPVGEQSQYWKTVDADIVAADVAIGTTAYGSSGLINGTYVTFPLQCDFTAANSTATSSYTPDFGTWYGGHTVDTYTYIYNNSLAKKASTGSNFTALWTPDSAVTTIEADIKVMVTTNQGMQGIACRMTGILQGYACVLYNGQARIARWNSSENRTELGGVAYSFSSGTTYTFRAELSGNTIDFYINDVFQLSRTDSTYTGGTACGYLGWYSNAIATNTTLMDNLKAW